jgi:uncharacterized ion transporter superfamily protein YfcC
MIVDQERQNAGHRQPTVLLLWCAAFAFLVFEVAAAARWITDAGGLRMAGRHFSHALTSDWMLIIVVADHLLIGLVVLIIGWKDAAAREMNPLTRLSWVASFIALGSPTLIVYLARRTRSSEQRAQDQGRP